MNRKVCIIHKVDTLDPRSFYKEGRSLSRAGFAVIMMGTFRNNVTIDGIRLLGFGPARNRIARFLATNYQIFLRSVKERAAVYHFHDLDFVPWAILLKALTGAKVIYDIHEAYPEYMLLKTYIPKYMRRILSSFISIMEQFAVKFFDGIIPNDNFIAESFRHKNNITVFNFPTLDFFGDGNMIPWEERTYDLFYHGTLPQYHFERMMNIAEKLTTDNIPNKWGIVTKDGPVKEWAKAELMKRRLTSNFEFLPYTDYLNIHDYLMNARIGIIPLPPYKKFMKNIPLKLFEFMGCKLPVVLSDLPPSRQFILGEDCAIAVEPDNVEKFANAISFLLGNPVRAEEMGMKGQSLVLNKYNWDKEEEKLLKLYNELI